VPPTRVTQSLPNHVRGIHSTSRYCPGKIRPSTDCTTISAASAAERMYGTFIFTCITLPYSLYCSSAAQMVSKG
jgi:hypothetical protein